MKAPVTVRAAVTQALLDGPAHGLEIVRRLRARTGGEVRLAHANVYNALAAMKRGRLVRSWREVPGGVRGARSRTCYELTSKGLQAAVAARKVLVLLASAPSRPAPSAEERELMVQRLRQTSEVSMAVRRLREAMPVDR
jgi:PadR family transcriptional regulator PadR